MHIQWYPGHMAKARRELAEQLRRVDVVLELCDARLPISTRNPDLDRLLAGKHRLLFLGKADLADPEATAAWLRRFQGRGLEAAAYTAGRTRPDGILRSLEAAAADVLARAAARGIRRTLRAMVVGVPNVGKSTFINGLCGSAVTQTADRPGVTRVQRWVKAGPFLELLDTPGLLWPRLEDPTAARRLAYLGTIRDEILDQETLAAALLAELMAVKPDVVAQRYKISDASDVNALLENACRGRGFLRSGGVPDTARGAAIVLDEFRGGKLGRVTLEMP